MLVDSHCHLDFPEFANEQRVLVEHAVQRRVGHMLTICTRIANLDRCIAIAENFPNVYSSVGTHPHHAGDLEEQKITTEQLVTLSEHPKIIAIGETGLDFSRSEVSHDLQSLSFHKHIAVAQKTGLPIVIHARNANEKMIAILREEMKNANFKGVLHCFSSPADLAEAAIELDFYISFSGILTFKKSDELRRIASIVPIDRLLVETDAPYLAPEPCRGQRNEPAYVVYTAQCLANLHGISYEHISHLTTANFFRLFDKAQQLHDGHGAENSCR